jgi:asparagine synthetase B (glutamine-hydrolysing)
MSGNWSVPLVNPWSPAYFALGGEGKRRGCQVLLTGGGGDEWLGVSPLLAADLIRTLDVQGLYRLWGTMRRSYQAPHLTLLRNVLWRFGARPLLSSVTGRALRRLAPGTLEARRFRRISAARPAWIAPDPTLAREMDDRIRQSVERGVRDLRSSEVYLREMRISFTHPLTSMEMEEQFEFGQRMGVRLMMPYWDADLVGMLYRVPPHLLSKGGRSKGLVRQSLARRFPQLGFERQKKVIATNFFRSTLLAQGAEALRGLGGTPCLSELGIVEDKGLHATMEGIFSGEGSRRAYHIWDVLNLEAWLRTHL